MRRLIATWILSFALFGAVAAYTQLIQNTRYLAATSHVLRDWAHSLPYPSESEEREVIERVLAKARFYDDLLSATHLEHGMVVNRSLSGRPLDVCDSLLFSSLRYVALTKLGFGERAGEAWEAIRASQKERFWFRHPLCSHKGTSKDMLIGLLAALVQKPEGYERYLRELVELVNETGGYFGHGPIYVSYMTPTVASLLRMVARRADVKYREMPSLLRRAYSTTEYSFIYIDGGFQSHLAALAAWIQLEGHPSQLNLDRLEPFESDESLWSWLTYPLRRVETHRLDWITHNLVRLNDANLFYRYLRLKTAGALTPQVLHGLRQELLAMAAFPDDRLPLDCDRKADYLWQRVKRELNPRRRCTREYAGVDYLWMAALLTEDAEQMVVTSH